VLGKKRRGGPERKGLGDLPCLEGGRVREEGGRGGKKGVCPKKKRPPMGRRRKGNK